MFDNPVLFALTTYGLTLVIAMLVAGIILAIGWFVSRGGRKATKEQ